MFLFSLQPLPYQLVSYPWTRERTNLMTKTVGLKFRLSRRHLATVRATGLEFPNKKTIFDEKAAVSFGGGLWCTFLRFYFEKRKSIPTQFDVRPSMLRALSECKIVMGRREKKVLRVPCNNFL